MVAPAWAGGMCESVSPSSGACSASGPLRMALSRSVWVWTTMPGARNVPASDLIAQDGTMKTPAQLADIFEKAG
eukprot:gene13216-17573_t